MMLAHLSTVVLVLGLTGCAAASSEDAAASSSAVASECVDAGAALSDFVAANVSLSIDVRFALLHGAPLSLEELDDLVATSTVLHGHDDTCTTCDEQVDSWVLDVDGEARTFQRVTKTATGEVTARRGRSLPRNDGSNLAKYLAARRALVACYGPPSGGGAPASVTLPSGSERR
ncbi:MAG: hypothetical protein KIT84_28465 [Labilithrix sp.]|nr:hypothetical protein [Labilithrix sp.]MCW5814993.1 hypothetical protein [Labilithrix sp.]